MLSPAVANDNCWGTRILENVYGSRLNWGLWARWEYAALLAWFKKIGWRRPKGGGVNCATILFVLQIGDHVRVSNATLRLLPDARRQNRGRTRPATNPLQLEHDFDIPFSPTPWQSIVQQFEIFRGRGELSRRHRSRNFQPRNDDHNVIGN